ncbi:MAG TPA: hypothetical protein ENJ09_08695 [Planctomycetes bacterium]|nr:hypothetical protein [Planctomycetota bacterium]
MAKTRTRGTRAGSAARTPRAKSRKPATTTEVEVVEEEGGGNIDTGIVAITTIVLIAAILLVDHLRGMYGEGMFF